MGDLGVDLIAQQRDRLRQEERGLGREEVNRPAFVCGEAPSSSLRR